MDSKKNRASNVVDLHPPLTTPMAIELDGEPFVNIAGVLQMARENDTPQCRALTRFYGAEYRARQAQPLTEIAREWEAFQAAWMRMVAKFGVPPIGTPTPWPGSGQQDGESE